MERSISLIALPHRCVDCTLRFFQFRPGRIGSFWQRLGLSKILNRPVNASHAELAFEYVNSGRELNGQFWSANSVAKSTVQGRVAMPSSQTAQALKTLGLSANASPDEISAAYRHLAQMYHPDKVAGLALEFQAVAEKRMREINAAYAFARRWFPSQ